MEPSPKYRKVGMVIYPDFHQNDREWSKQMKMKVAASYDTKKFFFPPLPGFEGFEEEEKFWFTVKEVSGGDIARYRNIGRKVTYIPRDGQAGFAQEQEFPSGDLMFERANTCVTGWNLEDDKGNIVAFSRDAWNQLPPSWTEYLDDMVIEVNPELVYRTKNPAGAS